jgi:hypothetical protein
MTQGTVFAPGADAQEPPERVGKGQDTGDATPEPLRLDPTTSLSMIYLREFERVHSTMRGKVRIARRAGHMLRMHWAHVQRRGLAEWSGT